jgi:hypothetical protein
MTTGKQFKETDNNVQTGSRYLTSLDNNNSLFGLVGAIFHPFANVVFDFATTDVSTANDTITETDHGLLEDDVVQFTTSGTLPAGLSLATNYHIIATSLTADVFKVSASQGGAAINITDAGSGTHIATLTTGLTMRLGKGLLVVPDAIPTAVSVQQIAALTAPTTNPRKDLVTIDKDSGVYTVTTGSENASPVDPTVPANGIPVARINMVVSQTTIENVGIDDLRAFPLLGASTELQTDVDNLKTNQALNFFLDAVDHARSVQNLQDGFVDQFEDQTGIDDTNSVGEAYDSSNDLYSRESGGIDSDVILMIHSDDTDESTTFTDSSDTGHTLTAQGNVNHETDQKKFGASSIQFDGTGDYVSIPDHADWDLGTGDFTIDGFIRINSLAAINGILSTDQWTGSTNDWTFRVSTAGKLRFVQYNNVGITPNVTGGTTLLVNTWYHVAVVRFSGTTYLFIDGVEDTGGGSSALSGIDLEAECITGLQLGGLDTGGGRMNGYIDELRFSKVARWTSGFTPPTSAYIPDPNITLIAEPVVALSAPDNAHVTIFKEDIDAVTLNTDLLAWGSRSKQAVTSDFATDDKLDATAHDLENDDRVMFTSSAGDLPAGLDSETVYYVVNKTTNDFEVSLTSGGAAVNITDDGTGTHQVRAVTAVTLTDEGTYSTYDIISGTADISAQPSDTDMLLILQTKNAKDLKIHGHALQWS